MNSAMTEDKTPLTVKQFEQDMKKTFWNALTTAFIAAALSGLLSFVAFYYNSNSKFDQLFSTQQAHTKNIEDITKTLDNLVTKTEVQGTKPEHQAMEIQDLKKRMDRYEEKQDKIYEILLEIKKISK